MKKKFWLLLFLLFLIPINVHAISDKYVDKIHDIVDKKVEEDKINIYLFKGKGCPYCAEEETWLKTIEEKYKGKINIYKFEVWNNEEDAKKFEKVFDSNRSGVPLTVIGEQYYIGFSDSIKSEMQSKISEYLEENVTNSDSKNTISDKYVDKIHDIVDKKVEEDKINIYLFKGEGCPHCAEEDTWLKTIEEKYKGKVNIYKFEVWNNEKNAKKLDKVKKVFDSKRNGVPFTVIGEHYYIGFSDSIKSEIQSKISEYLNEKTESNSNSNNKDNKEEKMKLPLLGNINAKDVSIPLVAIVLGFIDGFNPCAMWILLFLINMLFRMENKKRAWILGFTFLFISGFVYFLSMLGINFVIGIVAINWIKKLLALFILVAGVLNFKKYLKTRKEEAGCTVVDKKKRKKLSSRMKKIIDSKSFLLSIIGIIVLATSVNLIELACSLGFPMIFSEILSLNNIQGVTKIVYLIIYILFYMIDDIVVFSVSMFTLNATGITNKYNKLCTLVSAILMALMGILLLFKPEWLMLNF